MLGVWWLLHVRIWMVSIIGYGRYGNVLIELLIDGIGIVDAHGNKVLVLPRHQLIEAWLLG